MLAQLLSSGMGGANDWGQMIGNLAKVFVGNRGLKKAGTAQDGGARASQDGGAAAEAAGTGVVGAVVVRTGNKCRSRRRWSIGRQL